MKRLVAWQEIPLALNDRLALFSNPSAVQFSFIINTYDPLDMGAPLPPPPPSPILGKNVIHGIAYLVLVW